MGVQLMNESIRMRAMKERAKQIVVDSCPEIKTRGVSPLHSARLEFA